MWHPPPSSEAVIPDLHHLLVQTLPLQSAMFTLTLPFGMEGRRGKESAGAQIGTQSRAWQMCFVKGQMVNILGPCTP